MKIKHPKVTMQHVAESAGVSIATVSRVLSGTRGGSSIETFNRVIKMATLLGYELKKQRTNE